jgi:phosphate transport system protein
MARTVLDAGLEELNKQIIHLGSLVETALERALQALKNKDLATCGLVIASEAFVDETRVKIEQQAFRLLTLQQPLGGRDLRFATSAVVIAGDLERIGDGAEGIAQLLVRMANPQQENQGVVASAAERVPSSIPRSPSPTLTEDAIVQGVLELGQEARRVLQGTMQAFSARNARAARYLWEEDDVVDVRYHMVRHDLMTMMEGEHALPALTRDALILQRMTYYLWIAHNLERVADHCTNICERIVFFIEGDRTIAPTKEPG